MVDGFEKLTLGPYEYLTFSEYFTRIESVGSGLAAYVAGGDTVVIYAGTQLEWTLSAFACWRCGATVGTCYDTLGEDAASFAINQCRAKVVFTDAKLLKSLSKIAAQLTTVKRIVTLTDDAADTAAAILLKSHGIEVCRISELEAAGAAKPTAPTPATPGSVAVTMYTSGTTGTPKGVLLSHANVVAAISGSTTPSAALGKYMQPGLRFLAYLPLAHIMELVVELACISQGMVVGYGGVGTILATSPKMLTTTPPQDGDAAAFKPTLFLAAPAVLDRIFAVVNGKINAAPGPLKAWFQAALADGAAHFEKGGVGANPLLGLIFKPVQKLLGGQVRSPLMTSYLPLNSP